MKRIVFLLCALLAGGSASLSADAELTVLIQMQATNNLESFAHKNLRDILKVGSNQKVKILVELHRPGDKAWRYRIDKNNCVADEIISRPKHADMGEELYDAMSWVVRKYPAKHYALILWNHGFGVIDPRWDAAQPYYMKQFMRQFDKTRHTSIEDETLSTRATKNALSDDRGILFDEERRSYLDNTQLKETLQKISTNLLDGKKLDLLGMDACLMGMVEVAYQVKDTVKHFVASQEFEFAQGWSYGPLMEQVARGNIDGNAFGKIVVDTFKKYYETRTHYFTQSSVNLEHMNLLKDNIDAISRDLLICLDQQPQKMRALIEQARMQCLAFSMPDYVDLHSFFRELQRLIMQPRNNSDLGIESSVRDRLNYSLTVGMRLIKTMVTANTTGRYLSRAQGISIYFPQRVIDESYVKTDFAKESSWLDVLCRLVKP